MIRRLRAGLGAVLVVLPVTVGLVVGSTISGASASTVSNPYASLAAMPDWTPAQAAMANNWALAGKTELSAAERASATGITGTAKKVKGFKPVPRPGALGMVVNTVGILGGAIFMFGGDDEDDQVELPPLYETDEVATGTAGCGWSTLAGAYPYTPCSSTSNGTTWAAWMYPTPPAGFTYTSRPEGGSWTAGTVPNAAGQYGGQFRRGAVGEPVRVHDIAYKSLTSPFGVGAVVGRVWVPSVNQTLGNPHPAPGLPEAIPRYIESTANCKRSDGTSERMTRRTGPFYLTPGVPSELPAVPDLVCPPGTFLDGGSHKLDSGVGTPNIDVVEPYEAPDSVRDAANRYPECAPVGSSVCLLHLVKIQTVSDPEFNCNSVMSDAHPCRDWFTNPRRNIEYQCRYGTHTLGISKCFGYERVFEPTPVYKPSPADGTATGTDPLPPRVDVDPTPEDTPGLGGCAPNWGIGLLNPFWVMKSTACAMVWAFVPKTDFGLPRLLETVRTRPPGSLILGVGSAVQGAFGAFSGGGCGVVGVMPIPGRDFEVSCPVITSHNAYQSVYTAFTVVIYGAGLFSAFRMVTGAMRQGGDG